MKKRVISLVSALVIGLGIAPYTNVSATETKATEVKLEEVKLEKVEGKELDKKAAEERLNAAAEALKKLESFEAEVKMDINASGMSISVGGNGGLDIKNEKAFMEFSFMGKDAKMYMDSKNSYSLEDGTWKKSELKEGENFKSIKEELAKAKVSKIDEKFWDVFTAVETADGSIVISNKEKLDAESLKKLMPEDKNLEEMTKGFDDMMQVGMAMDIQITLDKDNNYKKLAMAGNMEAEGTPMTFLLNLDLKNVNKEVKIEIPEEALKAQ